MAGNTDYRINLKIRHKKKCCFCGRKVFIYNNRGEHFQADDMATVEHLFSKNDIRRKIKNYKILSCYKCNNKRNNEELKLIYKDYHGCGGADYHLRELPQYNNLLILMLINKILNTQSI